MSCRSDNATDNGSREAQPRVSNDHVLAQQVAPMYALANSKLSEDASTNSLIASDVRAWVDALNLYVRNVGKAALESLSVAKGWHERSILEDMVASGPTRNPFDPAHGRDYSGLLSTADIIISLLRPTEAYREMWVQVSPSVARRVSYLTKPAICPRSPLSIRSS